MAMQPQPPRDEKQCGAFRHEISLFPDGIAANSYSEVISFLRDALLLGIAVENGLWSKKMPDWVVGLQIADIDGDGNLEILVGSRDGTIRAYTPTGERKWEYILRGEQPYLSALTVLPLQEGSPEKETRIIVGLRSGSILALDKGGKEVANWGYRTDRIIRQLFVSELNPQIVIAASEDRHIHALSRSDGQLLWKFRTKGWVRCVLIADIDGDGEEEVLAGSGDKNLYILDLAGNCLHTFFPGYQVYAIASALVVGQNARQVVMSSNRKGLESWRFTRVNAFEWRQDLLWSHGSEQNPGLFKNRIHSICMRDINHDQAIETIVGTEDGSLVVLGQQGNLLWKQNFRSCIYRITAADIDYDGSMELVIGTEDHNAYVERLELAKENTLALYIDSLHTWALSEYGFTSINGRLTARERAVLKNFVDEPFARPGGMEVDVAKGLVRECHYEQALSILLRLYDQKVQYCWSEPYITRGYVWSGFFQAQERGSDKILVVGTDQGQIYGLDLTQEKGVSLWSNEIEKPGPYRVRMLCAGAFLPPFGATTIAVLATSRIVLLAQDGRIVQEQKLEDKNDCVRYACFSAGVKSEEDEILVGVENGKILFWDSTLSISRGQISMPQGIGAIAAHALEPGGPVRIIGGGLQNRVFTLSREGDILWDFKTQDRVQSLRVVDINRDGYAEIIVGSEDRNVYVLDYQGHLMWRYRTRRGVMDIDVAEIKMKGDSDDPDERQLKILISSADGYLYMLNTSGDLIWKYRGVNRMRVARMEDIKQDGRNEILVATEDRLELLQILDISELSALIEECLKNLTDDYHNLEMIRTLTWHSDAYIRGEMLAVLAGHTEHTEDDMEYLLSMLRKDEAIQVKRGLIRAIPNIILYAKPHDENVRWAIRLLDKLYHDPDEEVRLEIIHILPLLDAELFFKYLERSADHPDIWVRRAVVRHLDHFVGEPGSYDLSAMSRQHKTRDSYPRPGQVFALLLKTVHDEEAWVREESGRVLAYHFDTHVASFVPDLMNLLSQGVELAVLQNIAYSTRHVLLQPLFRNLLRQTTELHSQNLVEVLDEAIQCMKALNGLGPIYGEEWLQVYEEFRGLARVKIMSEIAGYQRITRLDEESQEIPLLPALLTTFEALDRTSKTIALYERRQAFGERVSTLIDARQILENAYGDLRQAMFLEAEQQDRLTLPGKYILKLLVEQWLTIVNNELLRLRGSAQLVAKLVNTGVPRMDQVTITLQIENTGQCAADNVFVEIAESPDFVVPGERQKKLLEVSTRFPEQVDFDLHLHGERAHITFQLIYDDVEARSKELVYADQLVVQDAQHAYHKFDNPYTPGPPIRDKEMFFGRTQDLVELSRSLGSNTATRVILLRGQRRMGKTSLIYRLTTELAAGPYAPVLIDMQGFALHTDSDRLLESFAKTIRKDVQRYKGIDIPLPPHEKFFVDAPVSFSEYLVSVKEHLGQRRLILLFDEFEGIQRYVDQNGDGILKYLRGIMQHNSNLSFLLTNVPNMPYMDGYQAIFFNLVQEHKLGRLTPEEARKLLTEPVHGDLEYDPLALNKMLLLTDGWPYFIHVISDKLVTYCNAREKSYVTINEVNAALDLVLSEQTSSILWIWQGLTSSTERLVLALLAQGKGQIRDVVSLTDLQKAFDSYGVQFERRNVIKALENLTRGDFVREAQDGVQYSVPLGLLKAWLRKEKPPERVVREVKFLEEEAEI
ncbi:MAG TPA: PQQ-binding-like beta-propeller repeat protein [Ktedonobacteraceae bacterium]